MMFAAFGAYVVRTATFRGMMSEFLTFVALDELELRRVFSWSVSFSVNVDSVFETVVGHFRIGGEYDERVILDIIPQLSTQWPHSDDFEFSSFVLLLQFLDDLRILEFLRIDGFRGYSINYDSKLPLTYFESIVGFIPL